jgi:mRNA degradation ribonuclease J1/J2
MTVRLIRKRAERAIIVSQKTRHIARLAQILRFAQDDNQSFAPA